jgi:NAD(P)-dependent dehydrogenase (short-subunit alcohol dehydrogenase family)
VKDLKGKLVLLTGAGKVPAPRSSVYNATRFGLRGFGHALAVELRRTDPGAPAIPRRRVEIIVAPFEQRPFGRVVSAVPEMIQAAAGAGALPEAAIQARERKR